MKTLTLLRHAKTEPALEGDRDYDRQLTPRGRAVAIRVGHFMRQASWRFDLAMISGAQRARQTAIHLADGYRDAPDAPPLPEQQRFSDALYLAEPEALLAQVRALDETVSHVLLIGHNPGLADLARMLAAAGDQPLLAKLGVKFPTGAVARLGLNATAWYDVSRGALLDYVVPADLDASLAGD